MREQLRTSEGERRARIHRRWLPCDTKVVDAWIRGCYQYNGETWAQFRERVMACRLKMADVPRRENIIVFTSAAPIAIWIGASLDVIDDRVMRLAGAQYNASYTMLRFCEGQLRSLMFNAIPHLDASELCTRR